MSSVSQIVLQRTSSKPPTDKVKILINGDDYGYIKYLFDNNEKILSVLYIYIKPQFQGQKIGSVALKLLITQLQAVQLYADVISAQSFRCFMRVFERFPDFCCSFCNYKFECIADVLKFLVPFVETTSEGDFIVNEHGGVHIIYNI
jgi:hypothetical protein